MSGTTTRGLPYPTGTDRVADGDNAIQSLAEAVDTSLMGRQSGTVSIAVSGTPGTGSQAITFTAGRFTAAPVVVACTNSSLWLAAVSAAPTTSGCTLSVRRVDGAAGTGSLPVYWVAVQ